MSNILTTSEPISQQEVDNIFLYLNNEQFLDLLRPVFLLKNIIGYVEAMVVSDSLKLYIRKEMRDVEVMVVSDSLKLYIRKEMRDLEVMVVSDTLKLYVQKENLAHCRQTVSMFGIKFKDKRNVSLHNVCNNT